MGAISLLPTPLTVEAAWDHFQSLARPVIETPSLIRDRSHMQALARAEKEWKDLFLAREGS